MHSNLNIRYLCLCPAPLSNQRRTHHSRHSPAIIFATNDLPVPGMPTRPMPFGAGKRFCLGGQLSQMEVALALTQLLRRFRPEYVGHTPPRVAASVYAGGSFSGTKPIDLPSNKPACNRSKATSGGHGPADQEILWMRHSDQLAFAEIALVQGITEFLPISSTATPRRAVWHIAARNASLGMTYGAVNGILTDRDPALLERYAALVPKFELMPFAVALAWGDHQTREIAQASRERALTGARVVSLPCLEWFEEQDAAYRESVIPSSVRARVSVEAGIAQGWWKYLGTDGRAVSLEHFGASADAVAPGAIVPSGIFTPAV